MKVLDRRHIDRGQPLHIPDGRCQCRDIDMGSYANQASVNTPEGKVEGIDVCILPTIVALWSHGVATIESCCGHGKAPGYIIVDEKDDEVMRLFGFTPDEGTGATGFVWPSIEAVKRMRGTLDT